MEQTEAACNQEESDSGLTVSELCAVWEQHSYFGNQVFSDPGKAKLDPIPEALSTKVEYDDLRVSDLWKLMQDTTSTCLRGPVDVDSPHFLPRKPQACPRSVDASCASAMASDSASLQARRSAVSAATGSDDPRGTASLEAALEDSSTNFKRSWSSDDLLARRRAMEEEHTAFSQEVNLATFSVSELHAVLEHRSGFDDNVAGNSKVADVGNHELAAQAAMAPCEPGFSGPGRVGAL